MEDVGNVISYLVMHDGGSFSKYESFIPFFQPIINAWTILYSSEMILLMPPFYFFGLGI